MNVLETVLRLSHGAYRVPLCTCAKILGIAPRTIYNRLSLGKWPLVPIRDNGRVFFSAADIAQFLAKPPLPVQPVRRGSPTKAERIRASAAGLSVKEWRRGGGK